MERIDDLDRCVARIVEELGRELRVAAPLALGKPNHLLNALYRRARADPSIRLTLYTALTLQRPAGDSELATRFLGPFVERVFGNYPDLDYELDRVAGSLPENVQVMEFYFPAGKFTRNAQAQRSYISSNYTHVARDLLDRGVNLVVQQVARDRTHEPGRVSLSCNADVSLDLMEVLRQRRKAGEAVLMVAQVNEQLPFMYGDADLPEDCFDLLIDAPDLSYRLFGPPRMSVSDADLVIGLRASALVKDGGELQIGIGGLGDAIAYALCLRQRDNAAYLRALARLQVVERSAGTVQRLGETGTFEQGLFASTEMLVDGFMHLYRHGIIKRLVYDDLALQRLLNAGRISEHVDEHMLVALLDARAVHPVLDRRDFEYLQHFGVLRAEIAFDAGQLVLADGTRLSADLAHPESRARIAATCLGERLAQGALIHAGFFLGPGEFYDWLRDMPVAERKRIHMKSVCRINQLYGHEELDRLHRRNARFVNTGLMVTLSGAVVSDGLEDGAVISGVGGQYNFVAMAHALPDGHSVLQIRSTRSSGGELASNVVWNYGHTTIPRHLRDLIITEYGIADLRGRTDEEVIRALIEVADSRFQDGLVDQAKRAGKLSDDYQVPEARRHNLPESYQVPLRELRGDGLFPAFPFGTDFSELEVVLGRALEALKGKVRSAGGALEAVADAVVDGAIHEDVLPYLQRMGLDQPRSLKETVYQRLLAAELRNEGVGE